MTAVRSRYSVFKTTQTLYTKGGEYSLNGKEYIGEYFISDNIAYAGQAGYANASKLTEYYSNTNNYDYDQLFNFNKVEKQFKQPQLQKVLPTQSDYDAGSYERYFVQSTIDKTQLPIEITPTNRELYGQPGGIDNQVYSLFTINWQLTGLLQSTRDSRGNIIPGIEERNKTEVLKYQTQYPNIKYVIKSYTEFARPINL